MAYGTEPLDASLVPISSVYSKENNTFPALQGEPGAYQDSNSNQSSAVVMSFLRPKVWQSAHNVTGSAGKTLTCAFGSNNIAGNSIVVCVGLGEVENGSTITLSVTDSNSNTYSEAVNASQSTTLESAIFYATNIASGANTITVTIAGASSTNTAIAVQIYEVFGLISVAGALDQTSTGSNAGSTNVSTGAIVTNAPNELAFVAIAAGGGTITAGTNWTLDSTSLSPTGGNLVSFGAQSRLHTQIASLTPSATLSTSNAWCAAAATFKSVIVPVQGLVTALMQVVLGTALTADQANTILRTSLYGKNSTAGDTALGLDASGRLTSIIQAVGGTALAADQSNTELRTSMYGKNSTAGDTALGLDASGRLTSIIQAVGGTALAADQSNTELRTSMYGKNSTAGDTAIKVNSSGDQYVLGDFTEQASLSAGSLNADLVPSTDVSAYKWLSLHINTNAYSGTLTFQGSNDNTNWTSINLYGGTGLNNATSTTTSTNVIFSGPVFFRYLRVRMTAYTSGTAQGTLELYTSPAFWIFNSLSATQSGTWTVQPGNTQNTTAWLVNTPSSDVTVFASGAQTTTQTQADQTNNTAKGIKVVLDMTNVASSPSVTLEIDGKDAASGKYYSILTGAAVTTVSTNVYTVYPGLTASANAVANDILPHTWRIKVTANNANSGTYSVGASLLP